MTDYIKREDALKIIDSLGDEFQAEDDYLLARFQISKVIPSADVVEVVRCKDCKHRQNYTGGDYCVYVDGYPEDDFYCKHGEKP